MSFINLKFLDVIITENRFSEGIQDIQTFTHIKTEKKRKLLNFLKNGLDNFVSVSTFTLLQHF